MPKIFYESWKPNARSLELVAIAANICDDYARQGYNLTLRQIYYQFVARGHIENNMRSYKNLGTVINKARLAGLLDWSHITDRTRNLVANSHWDTPSDIISSAATSFAFDKWDDQPARVEVWVEKEALADVVQRAAGRHDCAWFSCRGYVSQSELWGAARRHLRYLLDGQRVVVIHLGDHDPSGIDMTRDITDRLQKFVVSDWHARRGAEDRTRYGQILDDIRADIGIDSWVDPITVNRIALNMDQVEQYDPPPNPAKLTDSRATDYVENYGTDSWELDALDPATLDALIEDAIDEVKDHDRFEARTEEQEEAREILTAVSDRWSEVREFLAASPS